MDLLKMISHWHVFVLGNLLQDFESIKFINSINSGFIESVF